MLFIHIIFVWKVLFNQSSIQSTVLSCQRIIYSKDCQWKVFLNKIISCLNGNLAEVLFSQSIIYSKNYLVKVF